MDLWNFECLVCAFESKYWESTGQKQKVIQTVYTDLTSDPKNQSIQGPSVDWEEGLLCVFLEQRQQGYKTKNFTTILKLNWMLLLWEPRMNESR